MSATPAQSASASDILDRMHIGLAEAIRREMARLQADKVSPGPAMSGVNIELRFRLNRDDLIAFNLHHVATSSTAVRTRRRSALCVTASFLVLILLTYWSGLRQGNGELSSFLHTTPFILFLLAFLSIWPALYRRSVRRYVRRSWQEGKNKGLEGVQQLLVADDGLVVTSELDSSRLSWQVIERIEVLQKYVFLYYSAFQAIILPREAFTSSIQMMQFLQLAGLRSGVRVPCPQCGYNLQGSRDARCPECGFPERRA